MILLSAHPRLAASRYRSGKKRPPQKLPVPAQLTARSANVLFLRDRISSKLVFSKQILSIMKSFLKSCRGDLLACAFGECSTDPGNVRPDNTGSQVYPAETEHQFITSYSLPGKQNPGIKFQSEKN